VSINNGSGFVPPLGGGGGGGSITWTDGEVGYGISGSTVIANSDFTYDETAGFDVGFSGSNVIKALLLEGYPFVRIGDVPSLYNGTKITVEDKDNIIILNTENATIGKTDNFSSSLTGQFSLGVLGSIPYLTTSLGAYNTIANSSSGDVSFAGVGDLSTLGGSAQAASLSYFAEDNSIGIVTVDYLSSAPRISYVCQDGVGSSVNVFQEPNSYSISSSVNEVGLSLDAISGIINLGNTSNGFGVLSNIVDFTIQIGDNDDAQNGTYLKVDDSARLFTLTNVPTYSNDAAAEAAGLITGQLYQTTTLGITSLNIVP